MQKGISRRDFLLGSGGGLLLAATPFVQAKVNMPRALSFSHTHTGEKLHMEYHDGREYVPEALQEAEHFLRDFRSGDSYPIDKRIFDFLWELQQLSRTEKRPFHVISAYRSPATNAKLRKRSNGVAKRSLHMQGKAIDVRVEGLETRKLYKAALSLKLGGVGCYSKSGFIHLDTGRIRTWGS